MELDSQDTRPYTLLMGIRSVAQYIACNSRYSDALKPLMNELNAEATELAATPEELAFAVGSFTPPTHLSHEREPAPTTIHSAPTPSQFSAAPSH